LFYFFIIQGHILLCWREENHQRFVDVGSNLLNSSLKCTSQVYFQMRQITSLSDIKRKFPIV